MKKISNIKFNGEKMVLRTSTMWIIGKISIKWKKMKMCVYAN
jgi:hypothetical protein